MQLEKMTLSRLFEIYMDERTFLKNASPLSIKSNKICWLRFIKAMGQQRLENLNKAFLKEFVIKLRGLGLSETTCNITIRELNTFFKWLYENDHIDTHLRMQQLKTEKKIQKDFTDDEIKRFIDWKPKDFFEWRLYTLIITLIECGIRINEALTLKRSDVVFYRLRDKSQRQGQKRACSAIFARTAKAFMEVFKDAR